MTTKFDVGEKVAIVNDVEVKKIYVNTGDEIVYRVQLITDSNVYNITIKEDDLEKLNTED